MKKWLHKVSYIIDRIIPYTLVVLLLIIISEIFFSDFIQSYILVIEILDSLIITIFVIDLYFKYQRVRNFKEFLRKYWLDIIAIFPFFLVFRMFEEIIILSGAVKEGIITSQKVVHESVEVEKLGTKFVEAASRETKLIEGIEKEGMKLIQEAEQAGRISRTEIFAKIINPVARSTRLSKYASKDTEKEIKQEVKRDERFVKKEERKGKKFIKMEEKEIKQEVKKIPKVVNAFVFYERPVKKK